MPKAAPLTSKNVRVKGAAAPSVATRPAAPVPAKHGVPTAELKALSFRVPPDFFDRFADVARAARLKQNQLLFAALDAWEQANGSAGKR